MISFIVIGRNEGWKLAKCFKSVKNQIKSNPLLDFEVIYIDSDSSDNSIEIAKKQQVNKIIVISGEINAAVARNVGARTAIGNILFFMDGDIELMPFDLTVILNIDNSLKYIYVVGFLDDVNYTNDWIFINQSTRHSNKMIEDQPVTTVGGGIFIIEKKTWEIFGGMDVRLKRTQDRDLSLRMAQKGIKGIRKVEIFGLHHTIPYKDSKRMWKMLFDGSICYKGVMIRKHLLNPSYMPKFFREEWTLITLIISIIFLLFNPLSLFLYLFSVLLKNRRLILSKRSFQLVVHRILQDITVFVSIVFFYPSSPQFNSSQVK